MYSKIMKNIVVLSKEDFIERFLRDQKRHLARTKGRHAVVFNEKQRDEIIKLHKQDMTLTDIAKRYNCSRKTIARRLDEWQVR